MSATVGVLRRPGDAPNGPTRPVALSSLELDGEVKVQGIEITRKDKVFKTGRVKIHYLANRLVLEVSYRSGGAPHVFDIKKEGIGVQCVNQSNIWFKSTDQGICVCYRTTGKASMEPFRAQIDKMIAASDKMEASAPSSGFVAASDFLNASEAYSPRLPSIKSQYPSSSASKSFYGSNSVGKPFKSPLTKSPGKPLTPKSLFQLKHEETSDKSCLDVMPRSVPESVSPVSSVEETNTFESGNGFENLGNTCYMNAVLQPLLSIHSFTVDMLAKEHVKRFMHSNRMAGIVDQDDKSDDKENRTSDQSSCSSLYIQLVNLLADKIRRESGSQSLVSRKQYLRDLKKAVASVESRFSGYLQNDAHEFLSLCLDIIREEVVKVNKRDDGSVDKEEPVKCPVTSNFQLTVRHEITCTGCPHSQVHEEKMLILSLDLPTQRQMETPFYSINEAIQQFFDAELLEYTCDSCGHREAKLSHSLSSLPRVFILHLKRYKVHSLGFSKDLQNVVIPKYIDFERVSTFDADIPEKPSSNNIELPPRNDVQSSRPLALSSNLVKSEASAEMEITNPTPTPTGHQDNSVRKKRSRVLSEGTPPAELDEVFKSPSKMKKTIENDIYDPDITGIRSTSRRKSVHFDEEDSPLKSRYTPSPSSKIDVPLNTSPVSQIKPALKTPNRSFHGASSSGDTASRLILKRDLTPSRASPKSSSPYAQLVLSKALDKTTPKAATSELLSPKMEKQSASALSNQRNVFSSVFGETPMETVSPGMSSQEAREQEERDIALAIERSLQDSMLCDFDSYPDEITHVEPMETSTSGTAEPVVPTESVQIPVDVADLDIFATPPATPTKDLDTTWRTSTPSPKSTSKSRILDKIGEMGDMGIQDSGTMHNFMDDEFVDSEAPMKSDERDDNAPLPKHKLNDDPMKESEEAAQPVEEMSASDVSSKFGYRLTSVVCHLGASAAGGHYISDVFDPKTQSWSCFDDMQVENRLERNVLTSRQKPGYIFFYTHVSLLDNP